MKVLIIGSGGREHTLAWACKRSKLRPEVICLPGNGGMVDLGKNVDIDTLDSEQITDFVRDQKIDLTVIGPEAPLVAGLADKIRHYGYRVFGPSAAAARIEGSKVFSKELMQKLDIPTARFSTFSDYRSATKFIDNMTAPVVIKASGLAAGKGTVVCASLKEANDTASKMLSGEMFGDSGNEIVIEEGLSGPEMSLMAIVDGEDYIILAPSRDHKRIYDNDLGPNTGGMGAIAPVRDLDKNTLTEMVRTVVGKLVSHMAQTGYGYSGILYPGLMLTQDGIKVIEYNCRFGDPEAQVLIPLLNYDLLEIMAEVAEGNLKGWKSSHQVESTVWESAMKPEHAATVVVAANGYPEKYPKGMEIKHLPEESDVVIPFHAGTKKVDGKYYTTGGRVVAITGIGSTIKQAIETAYKAVEEVKFDNLYFRKDIGKD